MAGQIEGIVASLGLLYTDLARGEDSIMIPNNVVLSSAVVPLREPDAVDLRARLRPGVEPIRGPAPARRARVGADTRSAPHIALEEVDADEVVVRMTATPARPSDGPKLADEILATIAAVARNGGEPNGLAADASTRARPATRSTGQPDEGAGRAARLAARRGDHRFARCASAS